MSAEHCVKGPDCGILGNHTHPDVVGVQRGIAAGKANVGTPATPDAGGASEETCTRCSQHRPNGCLCHIPIDRSGDWRKWRNDGELEGQAGVIRQVCEAVAHLNPPDTGMGVFELVEWALAATATKVRAEGLIEAADEMEVTAKPGSIPWSDWLRVRAARIVRGDS